MDAHANDDWAPGDPLFAAPLPDPEVSACEVIDNAFGALDDDARARVLSWAHARYVDRAP